MLYKILPFFRKNKILQILPHLVHLSSVTIQVHFYTKCLNSSELIPQSSNNNYISHEIFFKLYINDNALSTIIDKFLP